MSLFGQDTKLTHLYVSYFFFLLHSLFCLHYYENIVEWVYSFLFNSIAIHLQFVSAITVIVFFIAASDRMGTSEGF